jgi:hypothetical protein
VFLFSSETETFGNVTLEAMASGLVVVAYDDAAAHMHAPSIGPTWWKSLRRSCWGPCPTSHGPQRLKKPSRHGQLQESCSDSQGPCLKSPRRI